MLHPTMLDERWMNVGSFEQTLIFCMGIVNMDILKPEQLKHDLNP